MEDQMSDILSNIEVGVVVFSYKKEHITIMDLNPTICHLFMVQKENLVGLRDQQIYDIFHGEEREQIYRLLESEKHHEECVNKVCKIKIQRHNVIISMLIRGRKVVQEDGSVLLYVTCTDITDEDFLQEKLAVSEESLKIALQNSNLFYWEIDLHTNQVTYGKQMREYYHLPQTTSFRKKDIKKTSFIHPHDIEVYSRNTKAVMTGKTQHMEWEARYHDNITGGYSWAMISYNAILDEKKKPIKLIGTARSIQDSKVMQQNFLRAEVQNEIWTWELDLKQHCMTKVGNNAQQRKWPLGDFMENVPDSVIEAGLFAPESREVVRQAFRKAYDGDKYVTEQVQQWSPEKQKFCWYQMIISGMDDESKALCTSRDITAEKILEQRYHHEEQYRENTSKNTIANCCVNLTRNIVVDEWSEGHNIMTPLLQPLTDYKKRMGLFLYDIELSDKDGEELSPKRLLEKYNKGVRTVKKVYYAKVKKTSQGIWIKAEVTMLSNPEDGNVIAFFYNHNDSYYVMRQMIAKTITEKSYDLLGYIDVERGTFSIENYDWDQYMPQENQENYDERVVKIIKKRVPEEDWDTVIEEHKLENVVQHLEKDQVYSSRYRYIDDHGEIRVKATNFSYGNDQHRFVIVVRTDITELISNEEKKQKEMQKALQEAESANKAKTDFLSIMSHDIRTPLNAIIGLTELTMDEADNADAVRSNLKKLRNSSDFLLSLVNDILDMAKIEEGAVELHPEPYSYRDFVNTLENVFAPKCEQSGIHLIMKDTARKDAILVDKVRVNQIFFNIFSNAVKYTPEGGCITYYSENRKVENNQVSSDYVISDTGIGMSEDFQKHLFKPFTQEDNQVTPHLQGTGIGLTITKRLLDLMGGTITVKSKQGVGTTVIIHLTCPLVEEVSEEISSQSYNPEYLEGKRILLVEDNLINMEIARRLLEKRKIKITMAQNGQEALQQFMESPVGYLDAILMDVRMPVMDGYSATKAIRNVQRSDAKTIPIIAMSANAYAEDIKASKEAGMNDYITKPVDPNQMFETIIKNLFKQ